MLEQHTFSGSTNINAAEYDSVARTLIIHFRNGGQYRYSAVPPDVWTGLCGAASPGGYFHANIRNAGFEYEKLA